MADISHIRLLNEDYDIKDETARELLNQKIYSFDNVSEMKNSTKLLNGNVVETLGFYSKNDGGNAIYKIREITNQDTTNEMNLIALSDENLIAELVTDRANVLQFGAKGDDETNDTLAIQTASNYAQENNLELFIPSKKFKTNNISFILIPIINMEGTLSGINQNTEYLFDYAGLNSAPILNLNKFTNNSLIKMLGIESGEINIRRAYKLLLTTDENEDRRHTSQCYNTFNLGFINQLEIYPASQNGYINENLFIGGRLATIYIHSDSQYAVAENTFIKCFSEDTNINMSNARNNNFYDIRVENLQNITCGENTYANIFHRNWTSRTGVTMRAKNNQYVINESTENNINLNGKNTFEMNKSIEKIAFAINVFNNPANLNKYGTLQKTLIVSGTNNVYKSEITFLPDTSFGLTFVADNKNFEYLIQLYDSTGNLITDNPNILNDSPLFSWDNSKNGYVNNSSNYNAYWCLITPNDNVKFMRIVVNGKGSSTKGFDELKCYFNYYTEPKKLMAILNGLNSYNNT